MDISADGLDAHLTSSPVTVCRTAPCILENVGSRIAPHAYNKLSAGAHGPRREIGVHSSGAHLQHLFITLSRGN